MNYKKIIFTFFILAYFFLFNYIVGRFPIYSYIGIKYSFSIIKQYEAILLLLFIALLLYDKNIKTSLIIINILFFITIIPFCSYYCISNNSRLFFYSVIVGFFIIILITKYGRYIFLYNLKEGTFFTIMISFVFLLSGLLFAIILNGMPDFSALNFSNIYRIRGEYSSNVIFEYMKSWGVYVIVPALIAYSLVMKKKSLLLGIISIILFHFLSSGAKYTLFLLPVMFFVYFIIKRKDPILSLSILFLLFIIINVIVVEINLFYNIDGMRVMHHFIFARPLLIPAWLSFEYFNFFDNNQLLYFSEIFPSVLNSPYNISSPLLIGEHLFPDGGGSWASTNIFGDSFANLGLYGPILFSVVFAFILLIGDSIAKDNIILITAIVITGMTVYDAPLFTVLASRGLIFSLFYCWLFRTILANINKSSIRLSILYN